MVEALASGDRAVDELAALTGLRSNLLAHHLDVLEGHGLVRRRTSEGDRRRRYVSLAWDNLPPAVRVPGALHGTVAFICTHNSARSQFAAALWERLTGQPRLSAGTNPARQVDRRAIKVASEFDLDIARSKPYGMERIPDDVAIVVCVCDLAWEDTIPPADETLHWSIPDPVRQGTLGAFRSSFAELASRIEHLAHRTASE
jgi:protein-tyrosine-phosphatase